MMRGGTGGDAAELLMRKQADVLNLSVASCEERATTTLTPRHRAVPEPHMNPRVRGPASRDAHFEFHVRLPVSGFRAPLHA